MGTSEIWILTLPGNLQRRRLKCFYVFPSCSATHVSEEWLCTVRGCALTVQEVCGLQVQRRTGAPYCPNASFYHWSSELRLHFLVPDGCIISPIATVPTNCSPGGDALHHSAAFHCQCQTVVTVQSGEAPCDRSFLNLRGNKA